MRSSWLALLLACAVVGLASCSTTSSQPAPAPPVATQLTTDGPPPDDQARETCQVSEDGGTYFLNVISETDGDLSACDGGTRIAGSLDEVLAKPGVDRRCIISPPTPYRALVGVYSDTRGADDEAAQERCARDGGSNG